MARSIAGVLGRRGFLLGGLASLGVAGVAVDRIGVTPVLRHLGLDNSPDHRVAPSGWPVERGTLPSKRIGKPLGWAMAHPPGTKPLLGALVCLHGRGEDHRFTFDVIHLHDVVASLGLRLGVAAVDGGDHGYWHARRGGTDTGAMLLKEFVPLVRRQINVDRLAILGWSMGGYGALLAAETQPDLFDAVVAASPAIWRNFATTAPGAFDGPDDFGLHDVLAKAGRLDPRRVRIDCGAGDPFNAAARELARRLAPEVSAAFPAGYHDAAFWRSVAPAEVQFAADRMRRP